MKYKLNWKPVRKLKGSKKAKVGCDNAVNMECKAEGHVRDDGQVPGQVSMQENTAIK